jgi:hypothetical protein
LRPSCGAGRNRLQMVHRPGLRVAAPGPRCNMITGRALAVASAVGGGLLTI